uniref:Tyr recombinase domain-containing protein n=1 Tax=uncultured prokaryote TaxID=198431 RepID=A0A0H5QQ73_9ZZZZ|nr:hypothetical protein [uncultured prokaryote]
MQSDYIDKDTFRHILAALTEPNRLAVEVSLATGLRISDVLNIKTAQLKNGKFTALERKTGKRKTVKLNDELLSALLSISGPIYVWSNRIDCRRPRTRQAVYKDIKRAADAFRVKNLNISPHSARKIYAVTQYHKSGSLSKVQHLLNHSDEAVTMIYAIADQVSSRRKTRR